MTKLIIAQVVTTYAGGALGDAVGNLSTVRFDSPQGICFDVNGNMYVADSYNHNIKKITPSGIVTKVAGFYNGFEDGLIGNALFNLPSGVCVDASGNIYVADENNNRIRKISVAAGTVSTVAGSTAGFADGNGATAKFDHPHSICIDNLGNLYVADTKNNKIRKITTSGQVSTFAGSTQGTADGNGTSAQFSYPYGICLDNNGNLYVNENGSHKIRKIDPLKNVSVYAGLTSGYNDGIAPVGQFYLPFCVASDNVGNIYVGDANRIRKVNQNAEITTIAGNIVAGYADGIGASALFDITAAVCVGPNGDLFVSDNSNNRIRRINLTLATSQFNTNTSIEVYPNPSNGNFNIQVNENLVGATATLYNVLGQNIKTFTIDATVSSQNLSSGVYLIEIEKDGTKTSKKILVN